MTSIFNTYYGQNLKRLNSSATPLDTSAPNGVERGNKFARVLADLETPPNTSNNLGELTHDEAAAVHPEVLTGPPGPTLSNFLPSSAAQVLPVPIETAKLGTDTKLDAMQSLYKSVNFNPNPVKFLSPESVSTPIALPVPPKPVIAEINRHESIPETRTRPGTPKLASATRLSTTPVSTATAAIRGDGNPIKEMIATAGKFYGIDPNLGMAIAQVESSFDPDAVSKDGHHSKGIFQLLDSTGKHMIDHTGLDERYDPFDPAQNTYLGVGYLRRLHDIFSVETNLGGNMRTVAASSAEHLEKLAVAAFNAGEGNVARAQARARALGKDPADFSAIEPYLPASTRSYVKKVTELRETFAARTASSNIA